MNQGGANGGDFNHPKEDSGGQELGVKGNPKGPTLGDQKGGPETTGILGPETTGILGPESKSTIVAPSTAPQTLRHLDRKKQQFKLQQGAGFTNPQNNDNLNYDNTKSFMAVDSPAPLASGFLPYNPALLAAAAGVGFDSFTKKLSQYLLQTYVSCNPSYSYQPINNPRRVLTKPSKHAAGNDGFDNEDGDYILYVNDIMGSMEGHQFQIIDALGSGTFGQVVKCRNIKTKELVALKVIKNKPAYYNQSLIEVAILDMIKKQYDPNGKHHLVRIKDSFVFRNHLCIAFEMLSVNLYELIKQNQFRGLSTNLIRVFVTQILDALTILYKAKIIHCDLKPENILLKSLESPSIKVIDLGSACHENQTVYTYIQSRFYRSPEVLLGLSYTCSIDMWSLGCIAAELFLGLPLFPGSSEYNQISRIVELLGNPPNHMCDKGKNGSQYFNKTQGPNGKNTFSLKPMEQYMSEQGSKEQPSKRYFQGTTLTEIINSYPIMRKNLSSRDIELEMHNRRSFIDFLSGMLRMNPLERWTPQQAAQHPFITQKPFLEPYVPLRNAAHISSTISSDTRHAQQAVAGKEAMQHRQLEASRSNPNIYQGYQNFSYQQGGAPVRGEKPVVDSRYSQVVGGLSDFQINPNASSSLSSASASRTHYQNQAGSMPAPSMMTSQHNPYTPGMYASSYQQNQASVPFALRKSQSQYSVPDSFGNVPLHSHNRNSSPVHGQGLDPDGHPRHGDQGERIRIPSRMPSVAASVDWELFEGGASVPNSYASSRQSSFSDMAAISEGRTTQSFASPNSGRHLPFQGRKMGSMSNEFVGMEAMRVSAKESFNQRGPSNPNSAVGSPHQSPKTHKKVKSGSAFGVPIIDQSNSFSRRPSVPSNFYPNSSTSNLAMGLQQAQIQSVDSNVAPFPSSEPIGINNIRRNSKHSSSNNNPDNKM